jgi:hypothetical protein
MGTDQLLRRLRRALSQHRPEGSNPDADVTVEALFASTSGIKSLLRYCKGQPQVRGSDPNGRRIRT